MCYDVVEFDDNGLLQIDEQSMAIVLKIVYWLVKYDRGLRGEFFETIKDNFKDIMFLYSEEFDKTFGTKIDLFDLSLEELDFLH